MNPHTLYIGMKDLLSLDLLHIAANLLPFHIFLTISTFSWREYTCLHHLLGSSAIVLFCSLVLCWWVQLQKSILKNAPLQVSHVSTSDSQCILGSWALWMVAGCKQNFVLIADLYYHRLIFKCNMVHNWTNCYPWSVINEAPCTLKDQAALICSFFIFTLEIYSGYWNLISNYWNFIIFRVS